MRYWLFRVDSRLTSVIAGPLNAISLLNVLEVRVSSEQYCKELFGVVALPDRCNCSLIEYANRIRLAILSEQGKINPDNGIISLLCDAARIGYEYGECAHGNLELAQQHLTQAKTPAAPTPYREIAAEMNETGIYISQFSKDKIQSRLFGWARQLLLT